jgi:hypothetical protein
MERHQRISATSGCGTYRTGGQKRGRARRDTEAIVRVSICAYFNLRDDGGYELPRIRSERFACDGPTVVIGG